MSNLVSLDELKKLKDKTQGSLAENSDPERLDNSTAEDLNNQQGDTALAPAPVNNNTPRDVTIKLWKNGFQVDDGAFRDSLAPANEQFLRDLADGTIPEELRQSYGENVRIAIVNNSELAFNHWTLSDGQKRAGGGERKVDPRDVINPRVEISLTGASVDKKNVSVIIQFAKKDQKKFSLNRDSLIIELIKEINDSEKVQENYVLKKKNKIIKNTEFMKTLHSLKLVNSVLFVDTNITF
eukprot:maker-scaffold_3-snap-gene-21.13-mRNA-1 protein AED:0.00 eAED:0.00 QI:123/1/1/1/1/1/3/58/238